MNIGYLTMPALILTHARPKEPCVTCLNSQVNCLEPHPHMPVLATSGLDDDVKLWIASRDQPPDLSALREVS